MTEEKSVSRPRQLWDTALKTVKGENTTELVEQFTSEMTLVAEGLCDDQSQLRKNVEDVRRESESNRQNLQDALDMLERTLDENQKEMDRRLTDLGRRMDALEKNGKKKELHIGKWKMPDGFMPQLIVLASIIAGAWVLVTILNLFQ